MTLTAAIVLIALLDLGIVLGVAAVMRVPFRLDRRKATAQVHSLPERQRIFDVDLAA